MFTLLTTFLSLSAIYASNIFCIENNQCLNKIIQCNFETDCFIKCGNPSISNGCYGAIINCPINHKCIIKCEGNQGCMNTVINANNSNLLNITTTSNQNSGESQLNSAIINCPINNICSINCDYGNYQCQDVKINAELSKSLIVSCKSSYNIENNICTRMTIKCPKTQIPASCSIIGRFTINPYSNNIKIYSLYGFTSVQWIGNWNIDGNPSSYMYCDYFYTKSCIIYNSNGVCNGDCNNPIIQNITTTTTTSLSPHTIYPSQHDNNYTTTNDYTTTNNYTVIIKESDKYYYYHNILTNLTSIILLILSDYQVDIIGTPIIFKNLFTITLIVSSNTKINGTKIIKQGLKENGITNVIVIENNYYYYLTTTTTTEKRQDDKDIIIIIIVLIICILLFILFCSIFILLFLNKFIKSNQEKENTTTDIQGEKNEGDGGYNMGKIELDKIELDKMQSLSTSNESQIIHKEMESKEFDDMYCKHQSIDIITRQTPNEPGATTTTTTSTTTTGSV